MTNLVLGLSSGNFRVPTWIATHDQYLKWIDTADLPEDVRVCFVMGQLWVDAMPERAFAHNRLKTLVAETLGPLIRKERLGVYFGDGMLFTSLDGEFTTAPDGMFVSNGAIASGRVTLTGGTPEEEDTRLIGSPDLVIEVVSRGSEDKDLAWAMSAYWNAGVDEYWVIDGQRGSIRFAIHRRRAKGFVAARKVDGWLRSDVLGRSFRFQPAGMVMGRREYELEVAHPSR